MARKAGKIYGADIESNSKNSPLANRSANGNWLVSSLIVLYIIGIELSARNSGHVNFCVTVEHEYVCECKEKLNPSTKKIFIWGRGTSVADGEVRRKCVRTCQIIHVKVAGSNPNIIPFKFRRTQKWNYGRERRHRRARETWIVTRAVWWTSWNNMATVLFSDVKPCLQCFYPNEIINFR